MTPTFELKLRDIEQLFTPFRHRLLNLGNRFVVDTPTRVGGTESLPTEEMLSYYRSRADGGAGLLITGHCTIGNAPESTPFGNGRTLRAWKAICTGIHNTPARIAVLLWHGGADAQLSPSGIDPATLKHTGRAMSREQIRETAQAFGKAAATARTLGFDAVELQASEGSLIEQFLRRETNRRHDEYGGSPAARTRFATEVIHAVRKAVGSRFPILFRFAQYPTAHTGNRLADTPAQLNAILQPISEAGVSIFHCRSANHAAPEFPGSGLTLAGWVRLLTGKPTISDIAEHCMAATDAHLASELTGLLHAHNADLFAVGAALHRNADRLQGLRGW